jgi:ribose-phosphate pyrophosphokinase
VDNSSSFIDAARHLKACKASKVFILATHGLLSGDAAHELNVCEDIDEIIVTNSYPIPGFKRQVCRKLKIVDISSVLAEAIRRTHNGESISYLFHTSI